MLAEMKVMATNFGPESTQIDPNIVMLVKSYLSRIYISSVKQTSKLRFWAILR